MKVLSDSGDDVEGEQFNHGGNMKHKIRNVLTPIDFSAHATRTLRVAASLCARNNASLTLLNVIDVSAFVFPENRLTPPLLPELVGVAEENLRKQADTVSQVYGVPANSHVVCGNAAEEIRRFIETNKIDMVIIGITEDRSAPKSPQESIAQRIAARTSCPVLSLATVQGRPPLSSTANLVRTKIRLYEHAVGGDHH